jgi:hypothetical protein
MEQVFSSRCAHQHELCSSPRDRPVTTPLHARGRHSAQLSWWYSGVASEGCFLLHAPAREGLPVSPQTMVATAQALPGLHSWSNAPLCYQNGPETYSLICQVLCRLGLERWG